MEGRNMTKEEYDSIEAGGVYKIFLKKENITAIVFALGPVKNTTQKLVTVRDLWVSDKREAAVEWPIFFTSRKAFDLKEKLFHHEGSFESATKMFQQKHPEYLL
jgi:hypothetical protein